MKARSELNEQLEWQKRKQIFGHITDETSARTFDVALIQEMELLALAYGGRIPQKWQQQTEKVGVDDGNDAVVDDAEIDSATSTDLHDEHDFAVRAESERHATCDTFNIDTYDFHNLNDLGLNEATNTAFPAPSPSSMSIGSFTNVHHLYLLNEIVPGLSLPYVPPKKLMMSAFHRLGSMRETTEKEYKRARKKGNKEQNQQSGVIVEGEEEEEEEGSSNESSESSTSDSSTSSSSSSSNEEEADTETESEEKVAKQATSDATVRSTMNNKSAAASGVAQADEQKEISESSSSSDTSSQSEDDYEDDDDDEDDAPTLRSLQPHSLHPPSAASGKLLSSSLSSSSSSLRSSRRGSSHSLNEVIADSTNASSLLQLLESHVSQLVSKSHIK